jgi:hypothetical protein
VSGEQELGLDDELVQLALGKKQLATLEQQRRVQDLRFVCVRWMGPML